MIRYAMKHKVSKKYFAEDEGGVYLTTELYYLMDEDSVDEILEDPDDSFYDESTGDEIPFSDLEKVKLNIQEI